MLFPLFFPFSLFLSLSLSFFIPLCSAFRIPFLLVAPLSLSFSRQPSLFLLHPPSSLHSKSGTPFDALKRSLPALSPYSVSSQHLRPGCPIALRLCLEILFQREALVSKLPHNRPRPLPFYILHIINNRSLSFGLTLSSCRLRFCFCHSFRTRILRRGHARGRSDYSLNFPF